MENSRQMENLDKLEKHPLTAVLRNGEARDLSEIGKVIN
jgi:hypothetical protein